MHHCARRRYGRGVVLAFALGLLVPRSAKATLPEYLGPGFPLETLDPAPAGDRFIAVPDAYVGSAISARVMGDVAWKPLVLDVGGTSITQSSYAAYTHVDLTAALWKLVLIEGDLPIVLGQSVKLNSAASGYPVGSVVPDPDAGDVGDIRLGVRIALPPQTPNSLLNGAIAADFWMATGNPGTLTGAESNRWRIQLIGSGQLPLCFCSVVADYAVALGLQWLLPETQDIGIGPSLPIRAALGLEIPVGSSSVKLRPTFEYFGTVPFTTVGEYPRDTHELMFGFFVNPTDRWSVGVSGGAGLSEAPGVPVARGLLSVSYRAPTR
jgi:hypothetical protein